MSKPLYMHTINGVPATLDKHPPAMLCTVNKITRDILRGSLKEIRREQKLSTFNRLGSGLDSEQFDYGYLRVYLD